MNPQEVWAPDELLEATRQGIEIWRGVIGTDGKYEVSNLGRARSWAVRGRATGRSDQPVELKCNPQSDGYPVIQLCSAGPRRSVLLHVAILEAFVCPRPGPSTVWQGGHHDDNPLNNVLTNLKWCTQSVNQLDQIRTGKAGKRLRECREVEGVKHYLCTGCETWKAETGFGRISKTLKSRCGLLSECRPCCAARRRRGRQKAKAA